MRKYWIILIIWLVLIGASFQARDLLSSGISSSQEFSESTTEAGIGSDLYRERFNITGQDVNHIVVLNIPENTDLGNLQSNMWRNYTLYLSLYLNQSLFELGYDRIVSEPLLLQAYQQFPDPSLMEIADSLVADDKKSSLINIISSELDFEGDQDEVQDHVKIIRDKLEDYEALVQFVQNMETNLDLPEGALTNNLPSANEVNQIKVLLTGSPANFYDILHTAEETFRESEIIAVIIIIIILALVFRSPLGILIPVVAMVAALFPSYLLTYYLSETGLFAVNDFLPSIIAMIGIAVAVDYNLFSLVRYREEYRKRQAKHEQEGTWDDEARKETRVESAKAMNATAGKAVMYSGITVMIGFSALIILGDEFTLGMAIGVSLVVALSILTARTLTPAILSLFGDHIDWPNFMSGARDEIERNKDGGDHEKQTFWVRWSKLVMKNPIVFLIIGILLIAPFISLSAQTQLSFNTVHNLPDGTDSREGFEIIQEDFNLGTLNPYRIVIDAGNTNNSAFNGKLINATNDLAKDVLDYHEEKSDHTLSFETINSLSVQTNESTGEPITYSLPVIQGILAQSTPQSLSFIEFAGNYINLDHGNNTLIVEITSNLDPGSSEAWDLVDVLRDMVDDHYGSLLDDNEIREVYVTGFAANFADSSDDLYSDVPKMLLLAIVLIFITLMLIFRSVLLPAKAIITISGSILFGLGALVFVFQQGNLLDITIPILDYTIWSADQAGVTFFIPVFLFTTILGLGMDYSIFIISRIREEHERGETMSNAVGLGLSKTAGVVTSAATIMTVTFMVFALSPMLILKTMGLAMAIAIVVDATIARIILLPSAMKLAGKYNFWLPKWLDKILPEIKLEH